MLLGYEPADFTVHPPPQNCRGWVHLFRMCVYCLVFPKNVPKGKPVIFGVIQVKRSQNKFFHYIHLNQIMHVVPHANYVEDILCRHTTSISVADVHNAMSLVLFL